MLDQKWCSSHYGAVYDALTSSLDSPTRNVIPGTDAVVARTLSYFRSDRETEAVSRLEAIALTILNLQEALRSRSENEYCRHRCTLRQLAQEWLVAAPMFPIPQQSGTVTVAEYWRQ